MPSSIKSNLNLHTFTGTLENHLYFQWGISRVHFRAYLSVEQWSYNFCKYVTFKKKNKQ